MSVAMGPGTGFGPTVSMSASRLVGPGSPQMMSPRGINGTVSMMQAPGSPMAAAAYPTMPGQMNGGAYPAMPGLPGHPGYLNAEAIETQRETQEETITTQLEHQLELMNSEVKMQESLIEQECEARINQMVNQFTLQKEQQIMVERQKYAQNEQAISQKENERNMEINNLAMQATQVAHHQEMLRETQKAQADAHAAAVSAQKGLYGKMADKDVKAEKVKADKPEPKAGKKAPTDDKKTPKAKDDKKSPKKAAKK